MKYRTHQIKAGPFLYLVDENLFSYEDFSRLHEMEKTDDALSTANFIKT